MELSQRRRVVSSHAPYLTRAEEAARLVPMAIQLEVIDGPDKGRTFPLDLGATIVVGRGRSARVRLNDVQVSREHCRIESASEGLVLTDAGSTGGTFVNGQ